MTKREKEIFQLERQIKELTERLENLKGINEKEIDLYEDLLNFSDFPWSLPWQFGAYKLNIKTAYDLIHSSPKEILAACYGFGPKKLKQVENWMTKHGLSFLTSE